jgi:hypothetical protein
VPGLIGINPDGIAAMMPQFQENSYAITDPLNPPESLPSGGDKRPKSLMRKGL